MKIKVNHGGRIWIAIPLDHNAKILPDTILLVKNSSGDTKEIFAEEATIFNNHQKNKR